MLMVEHGLIDQRRLRRALHDVWHEREGGPPGAFVAPPTSWTQRFEQMAEAHGIETTAFDAALRVVADLWNSVID